MFRRSGGGFFEDFDGPSLSSLTATLASTINRDNLNRAWEISSNAVTALAETGERALRSSQTNTAYVPPGGIGRDIASFGRGSATYSAGYQGPGPADGPTTHATRDKKKSHKARASRSDGDEGHEAARRHTHKKPPKKSDKFYSDSSASGGEGKDDVRRSQEAEDKALRKKAREADRDRARGIEAELEQEREKEREREQERVREREREHEALERRRSAPESKHHSADKHRKDKKKKDKKEKRDKEPGSRRPRRASRSDSDRDSDARPPARPLAGEAIAAAAATPPPVSGSPPRRVPPRGGEEELDRLFGFAELRPEQRKTLLDELFTPLPAEAPPPPKVECVMCPGCGCQFYPSEATRPPSSVVDPGAPAALPPAAEAAPAPPPLPTVDAAADAPPPPPPEDPRAPDPPDAEQTAPPEALLAPDSSSSVAPGPMDSCTASSPLPAVTDGPPADGASADAPAL